MPFQTCSITGKRGTFRLSMPQPRIGFGRLRLPQLTDHWHSDTLLNHVLKEGAAHPLYPGLILDDAIFEEEVPEFPASPELPGGQLGSYTVECQWLGDLRGNKPTIVLNRGQRRTLDEGWDERTQRVISWHVEAKPITGTASTDVIQCPAHGFSDGRKVMLPELTGGAGLTAASITTLPALYYVINATADTFQLAVTPGGSAVNFTTDITAGKIRAAEFCLGSPHPDFPYLYLFNLTADNDNTDWNTAQLSYQGLEEPKPYVRTINGAVTTANSKFPGYTVLTDDIFQNYPPADSGSDASLTGDSIPIEYDAASLSLTDTYISTSEPPTEYIGRFWVPPDPPDVTVLTLSGEDTKYFWPYGWKCNSMPSRQIPGRNIWIVSPSFTYQVPFIPVTASPS